MLFITVQLRDRDYGEFDKFVMQQEDDLAGLDLIGVSECFRAHRSLGNAGLLKIYVPLVLASIARHHTLVFNSPFLYQGTKQMMHFAMQCVRYNDMAAGRMPSIHQRVDLINLPLECLHDEVDLKRFDLPKISVT